MNNPRQQNEATKAAGVAAFFDLDGTLLAPPSLERRFFQTLRYQRAIPLRNYWRWVREALRLARRGIDQATKANKMYLRGVSAKRSGASWFYVPAFFREAVARAAWHARGGHSIVIVSGTLQALAERAARALEEELRVRGVSRASAGLRVCATRVEELSGEWTGRIVGEATFAEAKARAVKRIADEMHLDLAQCFAYGDSADDRWMLEAVGKPAVVNASKELRRIAEERGWISLEWRGNRISTKSSQRTETRQEKKESLGAQTDASKAFTEVSETRAKTLKAGANR